MYHLISSLASAEFYVEWESSENIIPTRISKRLYLPA